ncbi:MAG: guanylate kinase [candidate division WOR-3 bacterium]
MWSERHKPFMVVLSSPSGAGKTTICREVVRQDKKIFYSVSATTRAPREGERKGRSYIFLSEEEFLDRAGRGEFLEFARVYGHLYGTPKSPVFEAFREGKDVLADLDIQGMRVVKRVLPGTVSIFILPPNVLELNRRIARRRSEAPEEIKCRRLAFKEETRAIPEFDYLVINDKLNQAVRDVLAIINAERHRTSRKIKFKGGLK